MKTWFSPKVTSWAKRIIELVRTVRVVWPRQLAIYLSGVSIEGVRIDRWSVADRLGPSRGSSASAISGRCTPTATWVVEGYKSHPNQPITRIHWSISYTRVGYSLLSIRETLLYTSKPHKCHKKEIKLKRATRVRLVIVPCDNHWEKVCATSCDHLSMEFWLTFIVKLARAPYLCGWPCGDFGLLLTKKKENSPVLVTIGERERVEKDPSLVHSSMGIRFLVKPNLAKTNHPCHLSLLLVICLSSHSLSSLALFFVNITLCCFK
jgi:hypothetical protein